MPSTPARQNPRDHALFRRFPLDGKAMLSTGEAPAPYHIYDGCGLFIGGTCDPGAARRLLEREGVAPVQTSDGRALMGIWACDFTDASLGPHHELQFSFFVSQRDSAASAAPIASSPFSALAAMLAGPGVQMLCHGLWNNTPTVVAYNREWLSLNARLSDSRIERDSRSVRFTFKDAASGRPVLSGAAGFSLRASLRANLSFMSYLGIRRTLAVGRQPWISLPVLNPVGVVLDRNAVAETFTRNDATAVRTFDPRADRLDFGDTPYRALQFAPQVVQSMAGFKFVYLRPR